MKKILVVDDTACMRRLLKTILIKNGFEVIGDAENGIDAIEKYKKLRPEIVTMDISMPDMDGIKALTEIIKFDSNAVVVMISAAGQEKKVMEAVQLGAKGFIVKPFDKEYILNALCKF